MRFARILPVAILGMLLQLVLGGAVASAATSAQYRIEGRGWGHGIGMSQYGANGYAQRGWDHRRIISHYYSGTVTAPRPATGPTTLRVLLQSYLAPARIEMTSAGQVRQRSATMALAAGDVIELQSVGAGLVATRVRPAAGGAGAPLRTVLARGSSADATITPAVDGGARILFDADHARRGTSFRGTLTARRFDGKVSIVNNVALESYLRAVVPDEMPPSWHPEALRAQAIAARSYALTDIGRDYDWFDVYSDTRSQVYGGVEAEEASTDAAVAGTAGMVARVGNAAGEMARTFFFSTSGGRTAGNEEVWGSSPYSYLRSVASPFEASSGYAQWAGTDVPTFTPAQLAARLGISGSIRVATNNVFPSGYVKQVRLTTAAGGSQTLTGTAVQSKLGLRSTWFRISYLSVGLTTAPARTAGARSGLATISGRAPRTGRTLLRLRVGAVTRTIALRPTGPLGTWTVRTTLRGAGTATIVRGGTVGPSIAVNLR